MEVQWYPGHMARAIRLIGDSIKQVDAVCEIADARIPYSSRNPDLDRLSNRKPRIIVLSRADLADSNATAEWLAYFKSRGCAAVAVDCKSGSGIHDFLPEVRRLLSEKIEKYNSRGMSGRAIKLMIVGVPNVGKSTFINRILKRKSAEASDKPGVTRRNQWFYVDDGIELLDTPGVLPPKIANPNSGVLLACTGAVKEEILDICTLASLFACELAQTNPQALRLRYGDDITDNAVLSADSRLICDPKASFGYEILTRIALARKFILRGAEPDVERAAHTLLDEFQSGKLGRLTLELPPS